MATKQVSMRLGAEVIDQLNYLCILSGKSQAQVVAELVGGVTVFVVEQAVKANPALESGAEWVLQGGTVISLEEQLVMRALRKQVEGYVTGREVWSNRFRSL